MEIRGLGLGRLAAVLVYSISCAMFVAGCGGGGGGGSASPATTLAVTSSASSATAGGPSIALTAVADSGGTVQWTLAGPGTLSASSGNAISYTPPLPDDLEAPGSVMITARLGALIQTVAVALATSPGHTWEVISYPKGDFAAAIYANGLYIVGGGAGTVLASSDAVHWTSTYLGITNMVRTIAWGSTAGYVAGGFGGLIAQSSDGTTWTLATPFPATASTPDLNGSTFGAGRYVLAASGNNGGLYSSVDGLHWVLADTGGAANFSSVTFGAGRFVAAIDGSSSGIMYSDDGLTWTNTNCSCSAGRVAWGNGLFVALPGTGTALTSSDGRVWTTTFGAGAYGNLSFVRGKFYAVEARRVSESSDGTHWSQLADVEGNVAYPLLALAGGPEAYVVAGYGNSVFRSTDLSTWSPISTEPSLEFTDVAYLNGVYVAVTAFGGAFRSTDARHWVPTTTVLPSLLHFVGQDGRQFIALNDDTVWRSSDGDNWISTRLSLQAYAAMYSVAYGAGRYVAVGAPRMILTSTDAITWEAVTTESPNPISLGYGGVAYGNGMFVAVGIDGAATSPDGRTWTPAENAASLGTLLGVTYGNSGGFVAFGYHGAIWQSADGRRWTKATSPSTGILKDIAYANSEYVVVGDEAMIVTSHDGLHWHQRSPNTGEYYLNGITFAGSHFVVVGDRGVVITSDH